MTEAGSPPFGDPLMEPFWSAAREHRFVLQQCQQCGAYQFYPRPFCLTCDSGSVTWVTARGTGTIYAQTTVHLQVVPDLLPPYVVGLVQLDEGPRYTASIVDGPSAIGDRVRVAWRDRADLPPLAVFSVRMEG